MIRRIQQMCGLNTLYHVWRLYNLCYTSALWLCDEYLTEHVSLKKFYAHELHKMNKVRILHIKSCENQFSGIYHIEVFNMPVWATRGTPYFPNWASRNFETYNTGYPFLGGTFFLYVRASLVYRISPSLGGLVSSYQIPHIGWLRNIYPSLRISDGSGPIKPVARVR